MGIGIANGSNRAAEAAEKALNSPLLETSINGAHGVIMNITGGNNLSLFEVQEAAEIVASASNEELNMIFGSVINENLTDEIIVTVIATGFTEQENTILHKPAPAPQEEKSISYQREQNYDYHQREQRYEPLQREQHYEPLQREKDYEPYQPEPINYVEEEHPYEQHSEEQDDSSDIPTFLRNRKKRLRSFR
jgi:cell division protein FtsZ